MAANQLIRPEGEHVFLSHPAGCVPFDANQHVAGAANANAAITMDADTTRRHIVYRIWCSYTGSATPTGAVQIEDGAGTVVWKQAVNDNRPYEWTFEPPRIGKTNTALIVTALAGGVGVTALLDITSAVMQ